MTAGKTYAALMIIFAATFAVSFIPLGAGNEVLAWSFAMMKALIVLYGFMRFHRELESSKIFFIVGILALLLLFVGIMDDVLFRIH